MMTTGSRHFEHPSGPLPGRLILLVTAYAPLVLLAGLRGLPDLRAWIAVGLGVLGILAWAVFLKWLKGRQPRIREAKDVELIDSEVTGYIVSLLLPLVAASAPDWNDWIAYAVCGVLVLLVAFKAELWAVNPIAYALDLRAGRATVDGKRRVVLVCGEVGSGERVQATTRLGVMVILRPTTLGGATNAS